VIARTLILACLALAGCASPAPVIIPTTEPFCAAVQPICISRDDQLTEGTGQQIEADNLARAKLCKKLVRCSATKPTS
jgi:hypothetical protein